MCSSDLFPSHDIQDIASQYVAFNNKESGKLLCLIPKSDYQELINGEQTNEDLNDALTSLRDGASQVQYDEYQHKFIVRDYGEVNAKVFTLSDLKKEALWLHNYHAELAEEEKDDKEEDKEEAPKINNYHEKLDEEEEEDKEED